MSITEPYYTSICSVLEATHIVGMRNKLTCIILFNVINTLNCVLLVLKRTVCFIIQKSINININLYIFTHCWHEEQVIDLTCIILFNVIIAMFCWS